jgi:hypothetical protein
MDAPQSAREGLGFVKSENLDLSTPRPETRTSEHLNAAQVQAVNKEVARLSIAIRSDVALRQWCIEHALSTATASADVVALATQIHRFIVGQG